MAITFVAAGTVGINSPAGSGNPAAPGLPAGFAAGDMHICVVTGADNVAVTMPLGWTSLIATNQGVALRQSVFWKVAAGSDTAPTVTHTAGDACIARIFGWRVVSAVGASGAQGNAATATCTAPTITPPADNSAVLFIGSEELTAQTSGAPTWASYSGTNPTFAEVGDNQHDGTGANMISQAVAWGLMTPAGATGARTATISGEFATPTGNIGTLVSLTPTAAAGGFADTPYSWPMSGIRIPGYPTLAQPIGPTFPPDRSTFDVVTPLETTRFVNPLWLVMGPRLFVYQQPYLPPSAGGVVDVGSVTIAGTSTVTATVVKTAVVDITVLGKTDVSATVVKTAVLNPTINGTSTVSATVVKTAVLAPSVAGSSTVTLTLVADRTLGSVTINGTSTVTGALVKTAVIGPSITGTSTVDGAVVATKVITATSTGLSTVTCVVSTTATVATEDQRPVSLLYYYFGY